MNFIKRHPALTLFLAFLVLYAWHPFVLGIYSDDWGFLISYSVEKLDRTGAFSIERLEHFMRVYANRPISGLMFYFVNSAIGYAPFAVQSFVLVLVALSLYSFYSFFRQFYKFIGIGDSNYYSTLSSLLWLSSPWILGLTVWYSSSINLVSLVFYLWSGYFMLKSWNGDKNYYMISGLFYFLCCMTYESFYFQYFVFIGIALFYRKSGKLRTGSILSPTIIFTVITALAIIWNRLSAQFFEHSIHKGFNAYWLQTFAANILSLPYAVASSFKYLMPLFIVIMLLLLYFLIRSLSIKPQRNKYLWIIGLLMAGTFLSLILYSGAGYTVWGMGSRSRIMFVASIYLPAILAIAYHLISDNDKIKKVISDYLFLALIILMSIATVVNTLDWKKGWELQKSTIEKIPEDEFSGLGENSVILIDSEYKYNWVSVFDAPWAIDFQLKYGYSLFEEEPDFSPLTKADIVVGRGMVHPVLDKPYKHYWNGNYLYSGYDIDTIAIKDLENEYYNKLDTVRAKQLYIWNTEKSRLDTVRKHGEIKFDPFYNYDYWITWVYSNLVKGNK